MLLLDLGVPLEAGGLCGCCELLLLVRFLVLWDELELTEVVEPDASYGGWKGPAAPDLQSTAGEAG